MWVLQESLRQKHTQLIELRRTLETLKESRDRQKGISDDNIEMLMKKQRDSESNHHQEVQQLDSHALFLEHEIRAIKHDNSELTVCNERLREQIRRLKMLCSDAAQQLQDSRDNTPRKTAAKNLMRQQDFVQKIENNREEIAQKIAFEREQVAQNIETQCDDVVQNLENELSNTTIDVCKNDNLSSTPTKIDISLNATKKVVRKTTNDSGVGLSFIEDFEYETNQNGHQIEGAIMI